MNLKNGQVESTPSRCSGAVAAVGETPEALASGVGDMGDIVTPYFPDRFPLNNAIGFFIPQPLDSDGVAKAMVDWHAAYPQFGEELANDNLHAFSFRALESYGLLCKEPVSSLADLKGKRIRSYGFAGSDRGHGSNAGVDHDIGHL
mgnify:CR=1 FL=1